jgi:hypothetical protein
MGRIIRPPSGNPPLHKNNQAQKSAPPSDWRHSRSLVKIATTFASGLHFWWSWARWNHHNDLYNFIHRKIIVQ